MDNYTCTYMIHLHISTIVDSSALRHSCILSFWTVEDSSRFDVFVALTHTNVAVCWQLVHRPTPTVLC